jgi:hypothetical protein
MIRAGLIAGYLAALLAVDTQVDLHGQLVLGTVTWAMLIAAAWTLPTERRWQVAVVICAATVAELTCRRSCRPLTASSSSQASRSATGYAFTHARSCSRRPRSRRRGACSA